MATRYQAQPSARWVTPALAELDSRRGAWATQAAQVRQARPVHRQSSAANPARVAAKAQAPLAAWRSALADWTALSASILVVAWVSAAAVAILPPFELERLE